MPAGRDRPVALSSFCCTGEINHGYRQHGGHHASGPGAAVAPRTAPSGRDTETPASCQVVGNEGAIIHPKGVCRLWDAEGAFRATFEDPNAGIAEEGKDDGFLYAPPKGDEPDDSVEE